MQPGAELAEKAFRFVTTVALVCVSVSTLLHLFLLASDSPAYRRWVLIQIALQFTAAVLLWLVRRYNPIALALLFALSVPFTYINAVYTNYGNATLQIIVVTLGWALYGYLVLRVKYKFQQRIRGST
jgi:hypothetical protein